MFYTSCDKKVRDHQHSR